MSDEKETKDLTPYQIRNIKLLTHLLEHNAITDEIIDDLRDSELEFYTLSEKCRILEKRANIDAKTSLLKYKKTYLTTIIKTASRIYNATRAKKFNIVLIRFDIDSFSRFNTVHGHDLGDQVLIAVSQIIREHTRPTDYVIRFGGEEFDVILPGTDVKGAVSYIERVMEYIRRTKFLTSDGEIGVTISAGVSLLEYNLKKNVSISNQEIEELYLQLQTEADNALYEAKYKGKNQFCIYEASKKEKYPKLRLLYNSRISEV